MSHVNEEHLTALLGQHAPRRAVPGAAVGILRDGVITTAYYGVADVTTGEPVTPDTGFSMGSVTKSMVATVVAGLAGAARLSLDDRVAGHLPELAGVGWAERATVRDLLANRSGLPLHASLEFNIASRQDQDDDSALSRLAADVAAADGTPTSFWSYTNVGWCLLGRVIESATGVAWEDAMRRHLVDPAGMSGTSFATDPAPPHRASGHEMSPDGPVPVPPLVVRAYGPAGTSVVCTVTDLLRFAAMHLDDSSLAVMRTVSADFPIHSFFDSWCLGWGWFDWAGGRVWGWDSIIRGERAVLRILPDRRAAVALLTNSTTGRALYRSLLPELMDSLFGMRIPPLRLGAAPGAAGDLSRYAGVYAWPDRRVEVTPAENALVIDEGHQATEALPIDERTFLVDPADPDTPTVTFSAFDTTGRPRVLYRMIWGLPRLDE
jgi:CubicO group peptidase (beta-lactamase class C family)